MLVLVEDRWRWLRTHPLEVANVLITPPFLPAIFGLLRTLRRARVLRLLPVVRAVLSTRRILSLQGIRFVGLITLSLILIAGLAFSRLETSSEGSELSPWDGIWWATTTVTTVGYGDLAPQSAAGRILAVGVMLLGIGSVAMLTAAAAEYFVTSGLRASDGVKDERESVIRRLDELGDRLARIEAAVTADPQREVGGAAREAERPDPT